MKRVVKTTGIFGLLIASGLALSACVATGPDYGYGYGGGYGYGAPAYYSSGPGYYSRPAQQTFVFSYTDNDRRGRPNRNHRRHYH